MTSRVLARSRAAAATLAAAAIAVTGVGIAAPAAAAEPLPTDPGLRAPLLQITEVAPDTPNVNGADGYEFIEVYNASEAPIDFGDYTLAYLYTDNALTEPVTTSSTLWPAQQSDVTIPA